MDMTDNEKKSTRGWWMENNLRLIQCNLRETDAQMDTDRLISDIVGFGANALMIGAGGIVALYPTRLENQYKSPYLEKDLLGELVVKCHEKNIRVIARFDFSKAHISFLENHPDWFYRSQTGDIVNFNDMVHTCVNGAYQREVSIDIIREVLENYAVDGIFFNMFGYQTRDYSEHYHGICQCENCRRRFREMFDITLPDYENSPFMNKYEEFKKLTVEEMLDKIHGLVRSTGRDIAICTYTDHKVDIIRAESNSALSRPLPFWLYSASDNVMSVEGSYPDKLISNCAINAVDIFYRFMGVSKHLTRTRLLQNLAAGSGLDYCIIGVFEDYPETEPFDEVKKVFNLHKENETIFGHLESLSDILLIKPDADTEEYRGIFKMLKEAHLIFDVVVEKQLHNVRKDYRWVIAPSVTFDPGIFSEETGIIATSSAFAGNEALLKSWFGAEKAGEAKMNKGAYLSTEDKQLWNRFPGRNWVILDESLALYRFEGTSALPYMAPARYGPPERCGGTEPSGFGAAGIKRDGKRSLVLLPWRIGFLYYKYGYREHRDILLDLLEHEDSVHSKISCRPEERHIAVTAPEMAEVFYNRCPGGRLVQLINHTGFNGTSFFAPYPLESITIEIGAPEVLDVIRLRDKSCLSYQKTNGKLHFEIETLCEYEAILISEKEGQR